jgi:hypothetical protein
VTYIDAECIQIPVWEDNENFLYLDSDDPPNATTGQGHLVVNLHDSQQLPWYMPDGTPATSDQIADDWQRVKAMPGDRDAQFYKSPTGLHLLQFDIDALTRTSVQALDEPLHVLYPAFDSFPQCAQVGIADMAYGLGIGEPVTTERPATGLHDYPAFNAAANSIPPNFVRMAQECYRDRNNPAFSKRNSWTVAQFIQASKEAV